MSKEELSNEVKEAGEQIAKKRKRPDRSEALKVHTDPGENSKYIGLSLKLYQLPKIDIKAPEQVEKRITEFFQMHIEEDMKPTIVGMAMALGITRQQLWAIKAGQPINSYGTKPNVPNDVADLIKNAYNFMENLWEIYMQNGKINPVSGIFLGKNNFGYQDKTEYVLTPKVNQDSDYNAEEIKQRYLTDSTTIEQLSEPNNSTED